MGTSGGEAARVIDLSAGHGPGRDVPPSVVAAARRGDHRAFGTLVETYDDRLRALTYHLLGSREAMDDVLQETYLNAYRGLPQFRGDDCIGAWLYKIAYNTCLQRLRRRERLRPTEEDELEELAPPGPDLADGVVLRDELHRALHGLTHEQCAAVLLVHRDGFSYAAAAEILDVPIGTVASRVAAARAALGRALGGHRPTRRSDEHRT
jgi:RNA polymerase sigma-70 factor (ECF subfamily)